MPVQLHTGGRTRAWLGARFGDPTAGDRLARRLFHLGGALVLLVYVLPPHLFVVITVPEALLLALAAILLIEVFRLQRGVELPMIRPWEQENHRPGSYAYFAVALVAAVLTLPPALGTAVVLGGAWADPLAGELRSRRAPAWLGWLAPGALYAVLAVSSLRWIGHWTVLGAVLGGIGAGAVGVLVERPKLKWIDDDVLVVLVPAALLVALWYVAPGLTAGPP